MPSVVRSALSHVIPAIVALSAPPETIPTDWVSAREPLPRWPFEDDDSDAAG